jgi:hypothetical protein
MKLNQTIEAGRTPPVGAAFKNTCRASCQKISARIARAKELIFVESRGVLATQERLLRLALNEAEALAGQTMYPHLLFPTLATEKVQAVVAWDARQRVVRRTQTN